MRLITRVGTDNGSRNVVNPRVGHHTMVAEAWLTTRINIDTGSRSVAKCNDGY